MLSAALSWFDRPRRRSTVPTVEPKPAPEFVDADWFASLAAPAEPASTVPAAAAVAPLDGPVPPHSEACYCAVKPVYAVPCGNCRREGLTEGGPR